MVLRNEVLKKMELVILAAGMGSRFGGLKQIEPIDEYGNFIIDYSIYDAIEAGFDKVVFIIKEENYQIFKDTIGKRVEDKIKVEYAFQKLSLLPDGYKIPEERVKPLGTAQAILAARDFISDKFAIINADDFYGKESFFAAAKFLRESASDRSYGNVAYLVTNTMTENGSVKRGVLNMDKNSLLTHIEESSIEKVDGKIIQTTIEELNEKYNSAGFYAIDGTVLKACDNLAAFVEVWLSRRYGITSPHMEEGERSIRELYRDKIIGGIDFGRVYDEFPLN